MKIKLLTLILTTILLSSLVMAATITRNTPPTVQSGEQFTVTYSTSGVPDGSWFVAWEDTITGGCTPTIYQSFMAGTTPDNDQKTITFTAPTSGSCTFTGYYQFTDEAQTNFPNALITILGTPPASPSIKINEVEANPDGTDSGNEWLELYNPNAFSVDLTGWKIIDKDDSETPLSGTISANSYLLIAEPTYSLSLVNSGESLTLVDDGDIIIDQTPTLADNPANDNDDTQQRVPDGADNWELKTETPGITNNGAIPQTPLTDDLMPNYIRGQITLDGASAPAGTQYTVEGTGYAYTGTVDDNKIPNANPNLRGNGYFDTGDNINFNTGQEFTITAIKAGYNCLPQTADFLNGGNTDVDIACTLITNQPPTIQDISDIIIEEDSDFFEDGQLTASDPDGDETIDRFEVFDENALEVHCSISDSVLGIEPAPDFDGTATCIIRVYDNKGAYDQTTVNIQVNNINDPPRIISHLPGPVNVFTTLLGIKSFSINWLDIDNNDLDVIIRWFKNGVQEDIGDNYVFTGDGTADQFNISVIIGDGEFTDSFEWNLITSDTLTCSQLEGQICTEEYICNGIELDATDAEICCQGTCIKGPPQFDDAPQCNLKDNNIKITIKEPDEGDDFEIGEIIEVEIKIENEFEEKLDFDIETHLYDISEEESIEDIDEDIRIKSNDDETLDLELEIPGDVEEDNEFAIYVYVEDEEDRCNAEYVEIELKREDDVLIISDLEIFPLTATPGEYLEFAIEVENIGAEDQDAEIKIINSELGLNFVSDEFEIERFGDDDKITKYFSFQIPSDAQVGDYEIDVEVSFSGEEVSKKHTLSITEEAPLTYYQQDGVIVLGQQPTTPSRPLILLDGQPSTTSRSLILVDSSQADYSQLQRDRHPQDVEITSKPRKEIKTAKPFYSKIFAEFNDPLVRTLLLILAIVLAIGSVILFILVIIWLARW